MVSLAVPGLLRIETIRSASDLTEVGIEISAILEEHTTEKWSTGASGLVMCYDSITALLQFVEEQRAFRFLHVMTSQLSQAGVRSHFHLDPEAHDGRTVSTLKALFDTIVRPDEDSGWIVQRR